MTSAVRRREQLGVWAVVVIPITLGVTGWFAWNYVLGPALYPQDYVTCNGNTCGGPIPGSFTPPAGAVFLGDLLTFGLPLLAFVILAVVAIRSARGNPSGRRIGGR